MVRDVGATSDADTISPARPQPSPMTIPASGILRSFDLAFVILAKALGPSA